MTAFFFSVPTLRFARNHNWKENITVDGVVLKKQFQMSWLLSRSQWHVNRSAFAWAAVVSGCGGRAAVCFAFWKHGVASRSAPVSRRPFLFAITAVIAQLLLEHLTKNVSLTHTLYANFCVGFRLFSFRYITHPRA